MPSDLGRSLRDLERDVDELNLAPAAQVRARGEARRHRQVAAAAVGLVLLAGTGVSVAASGPRWPFTAAGGASASSCPPHPFQTNRPGDARIYMKIDATREERDAVEARLRELNLDPTIVDRAEAWRLLRIIYCDEPDVVAKTRPESLPEFFLVTLANPEDFYSVQRTVQAMPGVDVMVDASRGEGNPVRDVCSSQPATSDGRHVEVFLRPEATDEQREAVATKLRSLPGIASFDFSSHQDAYERFKEVYACVPDLVDATRPEALPESFRVTLRDPSADRTVIDQIGRMPGVDTVAYLR